MSPSGKLNHIYFFHRLAMRILIVTTGTRGDIEPCIALGIELVKPPAGHQVTVCTNGNYRQRVESCGLAFAHMDGDVEEVMRSKEIQEMMAVGDFASIMTKTANVLTKFFEDSLPGVEAACKAGIDCIISSPMAYSRTYTLAELHKVPLISFALVPWLPSGHLANIMLHPEPLSNGLASRLSSELMNALGWGAHNQRVQLNAWRERLGLPPVINAFGVIPLMWVDRVPCIAAYSPESIGGVPPDWESWVRFSGYSIVEPTEPLSEEIESFLNNGPPPAFLSLGSMPAPRPAELREIFVNASKAAGVRAIIAAGWSDLDPIHDENILFVQSVPHSLILHRCSCVVHHCGAGTTGAALLSGVPQVTTPVMVDQPFWAKRMQILGISPEPISFSKLTVEGLTDALRWATTNEQAKSRAREIGEKVRAEGNGAQNAARLFEELIATGPAIPQSSTATISTSAMLGAQMHALAAVIALAAADDEAEITLEVHPEKSKEIVAALPQRARDIIDGAESIDLALKLFPISAATWSGALASLPQTGTFSRRQLPTEVLGTLAVIAKNLDLK
eukprot:TRINITY_DN3740_c0_g1_i1.p1 TRINITY_DN3740_c0_g1~~TRINITY_DN3740_c0_g1_i1.p1  ORF type:complete len:562 (+),score=66.60 TRINITY_DN3740_c0_g1_i1:753-2438(+)